MGSTVLRMLQTLVNTFRLRTTPLIRILYCMHSSIILYKSRNITTPNNRNSTIDREVPGDVLTSRSSSKFSSVIDPYREIIKTQYYTQIINDGVWSRIGVCVCTCILIMAYPYILGLKQVVKGGRRFSFKQIRKHVCMRSDV